MVVNPAPVTVAGLKLTVAPAGIPEALKVTGLLNPLPAYTDTLYVALPPGAMGWGEVAWAVIVKSCPATMNTTAPILWLGAPPPAAMMVKVVPEGRAGVGLAVVNVRLTVLLRGSESHGSRAVDAVG